VARRDCRAALGLPSRAQRRLIPHASLLGYRLAWASVRECHSTGSTDWVFRSADLAARRSIVEDRTRNDSVGAVEPTDLDGRLAGGLDASRIAVA
jgi:hypothetical protein